MSEQTGRAFETALELLSLLNVRPNLDVSRRIVDGAAFYASAVELNDGLDPDYVVAQGASVDEVLAKMCSQLLTKLEKRLDKCAASGALEAARRIRDGLKAKP